MIASQSYDPLHYGVLSSDVIIVYHRIGRNTRRIRKLGLLIQVLDALGIAAMILVVMIHFGTYLALSEGIGKK